MTVMTSVLTVIGDGVAIDPEVLGRLRRRRRETRSRRTWRPL